MAARLVGTTSTYLAQHAHQPVDWWPWSAGAFAEARRRDVPVLLSVGYAACHWCHVMAHESFDDPVLAAQLNRDFVAIKVDREERPDVDAVYMSATQALTGQGGWPMTCFLTPDGDPFYAGTYFPPVATRGLPSFGQLLTAIAEAWAGERDQVLSAAGRIGASLAEIAAPVGGRPLAPDDLASAAADLLDAMDPVHGGFAGAPKFPPSMVLEFLLRHHERTGSARPLDAVTLTLDRMARGGIYDQVGGGFARYSVDATWHVPHFEKMLDDNAQLLRVYAHHARLTGSALSARVVGQIAEFLLRDMALPSGAFAAALDADTGGIEGATYLWTPGQLIDVLGSADGSAAAALFALPDRGRPGAYRPGEQPDHDGELADRVPRLPADPADAAWFDEVRGRLLDARARRPQPARDELVVLRSNGLAVAALAEAGALFDRSDWIAAAVRSAGYLLDTHRVDGRWRRSSRDGRTGPGPAVLVDHGDLAGGLLALFQATGDATWLAAARDVLDIAVAHFADRAAAADRAADADRAAAADADVGVDADRAAAAAAAAGVGAGADSDAGDPAPGGPAGAVPDGSAETVPGGFADTADDAEGLIVRPRDPTDGAAPSGLASVSHALLTLAALTGEGEYRRRAEAAQASVGELAARFPRSAGWHLAAAEALAAGPLQVAVAGPDTVDRAALATAARRLAPGGAVLDVGRPDEPGHPLLAARPAVAGRPAVYVCRGFVCDRPVTDVDALRAALRAGVPAGP